MTVAIALMLVTNLVLLIGYLISNRTPEIPRSNVLPPGERHDDPNTLAFRVSLRLRRVNPVLVAFTVALTICCVPLLLVLEQQKTIQNQRAESIGLLCDINGILITFISAPPDLPRDAPALAKLREERCQDLIDDIKGTR